MKKLYLILMLFSVCLLSCSGDDDEEKMATIGLSVHYHFSDTPADSKLGIDGYCWFGLFSCEQSSISSDEQDVYNIADKKMVTLKDGSILKPVRETSTTIGTCTLEGVPYGRYTVVTYFRNGTIPTSSHYYYYGAKTVTIDNPSANTCRFEFEVGTGLYGKLYNQ